MNETITKKCIVCEKSFETRKGKARGRNLRIGLRKLNTLTCSKKCSKAYERIYGRIKQNINYKREIEEKKFLEILIHRMESYGYRTKDEKFIENVGRRAFKILKVEK